MLVEIKEIYSSIDTLLVVYILRWPRPAAYKTLFYFTPNDPHFLQIDASIA